MKVSGTDLAFGLSSHLLPLKDLMMFLTPLDENIDVACLQLNLIRLNIINPNSDVYPEV